MGETTMLFLLEKIRVVVKNEVLPLRFTTQELEEARSELENLRAMMRDADAVEEGEEELKRWLQQVREVIQDCEDVFDELLILRIHDHGGVFFTRISRFVKSMKARRRLRANLRGINSKIGVIKKELKRQEEKRRNLEQTSKSKNVGRHGDPLLVEKSSLVGIDGPKRLLTEWLVDGGSDREVISVTAMPGMGKTTLAKQVYDEVKKHFKAHAWITVSRSLDEQELLVDMVKQLYQAIRCPHPEDLHTFKAQRLKEVIKDFLSKRRYLIVLDDLWQLNDWNYIHNMLPKNNTGSRIMLTTQKNNIASAASVDHPDKVYHLKPLAEAESWELFCKKTFRNEEICPSYLTDICKDIMQRCEGLPLAIEAIGGVLAAKSRDFIVEWITVHRSLASEINEHDMLQHLKQVLSLSFNDLSDNLRSCLLYMTIFPGDHLIERARLVRLWVAEGFLLKKEGKTPEDVADDYFNELLDRNLIQPVERTSDGRVKKCRVHDVLRDIIVAESRAQNFAIIANEQNLQWPDQIRRLSIHNSQPNIQPGMSVSQLRSLFMFGIKEMPRANVLLPAGLRLLRVLDLQSSPLKTFPAELRPLSLLKYLCLRNTSVKTLPSFIGELKNLETLDLKHSMVSELPIQILNLRLLRHILVYRVESEFFLRFQNKTGFKALANIGRLTSLQKLCFIDADKNGGALMNQLGKLTQLRRLGILKLKFGDGQALCSNIAKLVNLRALSINAYDENEITDLQYLSSPPLLIQRLYLKGRMHTLPPWILSLQGLIRLHLTWSHMNDDPLISLKDLPNLIHLELLQAFNGRALCFHSGGFKKLRLLTIDEFDKLEHLEVEKGAMPCVQKLNIQRCKKLIRVPSGIEHLSTLRVLEFLDMPKELMKTLNPEENGDDYQRVASIPQVIFTFSEDDVWKVQFLVSSFDKSSLRQLYFKSGTPSDSRPK